MKHLILLKIQNMVGINLDLLQWFTILLIKNFLVALFCCTEELYKPIIRKFRKLKVYFPFKDNIWGADLADMKLISKFNKGFQC